MDTGKNLKTTGLETIEIGSGKITIRKWKGKDKRNFIAAMKKESVDEKEVMDALVYSCIAEPNVVLSTEEFRYVLSRIRAISIGDDVKYTFQCPSCYETTEYEYKITELITGSFNRKDTIDVPGLNIKLGNIQNKDFYIQQVQEDSIYDFLLRIESINDNNAFTLDEVLDMFDDLDVDVIDNVMEQWEDIRFKVDDLNTVACKCGHDVEYHFDEIPEFFPTSWFKDGDTLGL